jgi:protein-tyrosine kinase
MSRIDEALRRAGGDRSVASSNYGTQQDAFVSAWETDTGSSEPPRATPLDRADRPEPPRTPTVDRSERPRGLEVVRSNRIELSDDFAPKWRERLVASPNANPILVEQFRRLAAGLHQAQADANTKVVMVTSATPGDGKTLTGINLALILSESYRRRVLLIDADLRRPSITDTSEMPHVMGLSEVLRSRFDQKVTVLQITDSLALLPAGRPDPDPTGGLSSERMQRIIQDAAAQFDWVVVDAPPIGSVSDASLLANLVDTTILVVRAKHSPAALVKKAVEMVGRERIAGVVLNGVDGMDEELYTYYQTEPVKSVTKA